jgi:hypothetical protein
VLLEATMACFPEELVQQPLKFIALWLGQRPTGQCQPRDTNMVGTGRKECPVLAL